MSHLAGKDLAFLKTSRLLLNHKQPVAVATEPKVILKVTATTGGGDV